MKLSDFEKVNFFVQLLKQNTDDLRKLEECERDALDVAYIQFFRVADLSESPLGHRFFGIDKADGPRRWVDNWDREEFSKKVRELMKEFIKREIHACRLELSKLGVDAKDPQ